MTKEELMAIIIAAFDGVEQPTDITLHVAEEHDNYDYDHDAEHRQKDYIGRWQDVPYDHLEYCRCALNYLTPIGMRYYFPASMIWYLKNLDNDKIYKNHVLYALLTYPEDHLLNEYVQTQFSLFNAKQLKACALFVKFCKEEATRRADLSDAWELYEDYWYQYLQDNNNSE